MRRSKQWVIRGQRHTLGRGTAAAMALLAVMAQQSGASEPIDGFVTPFRTVNVATAQTGIVREVVVAVGDLVEPEQILARLDDEVHSALLQIAEMNMHSEGRLSAAQAEVRIRDQRLRKLQELISRGSARPEEVERAEADREIAAAQLRAIREQLAIKRLEYERARIQLERRSVRAPMRGVVLRLQKEAGEFIGPHDPQLMTIVQLDPLLAVFAVPSRHAHRLRAGERVRVNLSKAKTVVEAAVESVSPVVDGKSGTMRVEVRMDNPQHRFYSGEPCSLHLDGHSD